MSKRYMKRCSTSPIMREMHINGYQKKTQTSDNKYYPIEVPWMWRTGNPLYTMVGNTNWWPATREQCMHIPQKLKT